MEIEKHDEVKVRAYREYKLDRDDVSNIVIKFIKDKYNESLNNRDYDVYFTSNSSYPPDFPVTVVVREEE